MARPDKVYTRFRGVVAADLTGVFGDTVPDLICVDIDGNGQLVAAALDSVKGIIWTPEGKASPDVADFNVAKAGSVMTVFVAAEFVSDAWASPALAAGDEVFSAAAGDVATTGTQLVGFMVDSDEGGDRLVVNV